MFDVTSRVIQLLGVGLKQSGQTGLTSETELTSAGTRISFGSASLSVESDSSASVLRKAIGFADLTIESSLVADAKATLNVTITGDFDAALTGTANVTFRSVNSALTVQTELVSDGTQFYGGQSSLSAQTTLASAALRISLGGGVLTGDSAMNVAAVRRTFAESGMSSDLGSSVSTSPVRIRYGDSALEGDLATMEGAALIRVFGDSTMQSEALTFTATPGTVYRLVLSTVKQAITDDYLLKRYPIDVGLALVVRNGVVTETETPSQTELAEADYYFLGGRNNPITPSQRATLVAAGFGSYIQEV